MSSSSARLSLVFFLSLGVVVPACGGSSEPNFVGMIDGEAYEFGSGFFALQTSPQPDLPNGVRAAGFLTDVPNSCQVGTTILGEGRDRRGFRGLTFVAQAEGSTELPLGTYPIVSGRDIVTPLPSRFAFFQLQKYDADCVGTILPAEDGTFTVTSVSADLLEGTYSTSIGTDPVEGSFRVAACPQFASTNAAQGARTCEDL